MRLQYFFHYQLLIRLVTSVFSGLFDGPVFAHQLSLGVNTPAWFQIGYSGIDLWWWSLDHLRISPSTSSVLLWHQVVHLPRGAVKLLVTAWYHPASIWSFTFGCRDNLARQTVTHTLSHWAGHFIPSQSRLSSISRCVTWGCVNV